MDQSDRVVENRHCDDSSGGGGFFWFFTGAGRYGAGQRIDRSRGELVHPSDRAGLARHNGFGSTARGTSSGGVGRSTGGTRGGFGGFGGGS